MGLIREIFAFVDSSQLISKLTTWDAREQAIKQARFGCKEKKKPCLIEMEAFIRSPRWARKLGEFGLTVK